MLSTSVGLGSRDGRELKSWKVSTFGSVSQKTSLATTQSEG